MNIINIIDIKMIIIVLISLVFINGGFEVVDIYFLFLYIWFFR